VKDLGQLVWIARADEQHVLLIHLAKYAAVGSR
jgi:hypothetical protein